MQIFLIVETLEMSNFFADFSSANRYNDGIGIFHKKKIEKPKKINIQDTHVAYGEEYKYIYNILLLDL